MEKDLEAMLMIPRAELDALVSSRFPEGKDDMEYYDGITHKGMFGLPKKIRNTCEKETRVMTKANPVFMH